MTNAFIPRDMSDAILRIVKSFPVVTVTGPRQSGKTTLCRELFPKMSYVSMEDILVRMKAEMNPRRFLNQFSQGGIIDEVQAFPELLNALQVVVDEDKFSGTDRKFLLTGSNNFALLDSVSQSMAGRTAVFNLLPLSLHELVNSGFVKSTSQYILNGGYPAVWDNGEDVRSAILNSYIETYVERDVRKLLNIKDAHRFILFLRLCAGRIGTELNRSSLSVEIGVSVNTIDSWISVLEASYVLFLLPPWFSNIGKRLTKSPKVYFYDTGLAAALMGIRTEGQLDIHPLRGALFENLVVLEMIKTKLNKGETPDLYFYRDKTGREIDIIEDSGIALNAYEIKSATQFDKSYFRHIDYLDRLMPGKLQRRAVIYDGQSFVTEDGKELLDYRSVGN